MDGAVLLLDRGQSFSVGPPRFNLPPAAQSDQQAG